MSKYWYEVERHGEWLSSSLEIRFSGKTGKAKARRYAKESSAKNTENDYVINGYDIGETWRNGKRI